MDEQKLETQKLSSQKELIDQICLSANLKLDKAVSNYAANLSASKQNQLEHAAKAINDLNNQYVLDLFKIKSEKEALLKKVKDDEKAQEQIQQIEANAKELTEKLEQKYAHDKQEHIAQINDTFNKAQDALKNIKAQYEKNI